MSQNIPDAITGYVSSITSSSKWKDADVRGRRELVRSLAVQTAADNVPEDQRGPLLEKLYDEAGSVGIWGTVATAATEGLKSIPAGGGAIVGGLSDAAGITDGKSAGRIGEGLQDLADSAAQRAKQLDPNDLQEQRDAALADFKRDIDNGLYPDGAVAYLTNDDTKPEIRKAGEKWFMGWAEVLLRNSVMADRGESAGKDEYRLSKYRQSGRALYDPGKWDLVADYMATRDPDVWRAIEGLVQETDTGWKIRLQQAKESSQWDSKAQGWIDKYMPDGTPGQGLLDELSQRVPGFQRSPIDMAMTVLPMLRGAKALQAARGGRLAQAATQIAKSGAEEFVSGAATEALSKSGSATWGEIMDAGTMEALGGLSTTAGSTAAGAGLKLLSKARPQAQTAPAPAATAAPVPAEASNPVPEATPPSSEAVPVPAPAASPAGEAVGELLPDLLPEAEETISPEAPVSPPENPEPAPDGVEPVADNSGAAVPGDGAPGELIEPGRVETPPVPETAEAVTEQARLAADPASTRAAVLVTPGTPKPPRTAGLLPLATPHGLVLYNPRKITRAEVQRAGEGDVFDAGILGMSGNPAGPGSVAVTASTPAAPNVQAELVADTAAVPAAVEAAQQAAPGATVEVKPAAQVLDERGSGANNAAPTAAAQLAAGAQPGSKVEAGQTAAGGTRVAHLPPAPGEPAEVKPKKPSWFRIPPNPIEGQRDAVDFLREQKAARFPRRKKTGLGDNVARGGEHDALVRLHQDMPAYYAAITRPGGTPLDVLAEQAFTEGLITSPDPNALIEQFRKDLNNRKRNRKRAAETGKQNEQRLKDQERAAAREAKRQDAAWIKATREGERSIRAAELDLGDVIEVEGIELRVIEKTPDAVVLRDGEEFGTQRVHPEDVIGYESIRPDWSTDSGPADNGTAEAEDYNSFMDDEPAPVPAPAPEIQADPFRGDFLAGTADDPFNLVAETTEDRLRREAAEDKARKAREEREAAKRAAAAEKAQGKLFGEDPPAKSTLESWADNAIAEGRKQVHALGALDPKLAAAYAVKGAYLISRGVRDFAQWSAEMLSRFGEAVRPHLRAIFAEAQKRDIEPRLDDASPVRPVPEGWDYNQFGARVEADPRLHESWRATFTPALYKTFGFDELVKRVNAWIGQHGGLENAARLFLDPEAQMEDYARIALGQVVAQGLETRAQRAIAAGDKAAAEATEAEFDRVIKRLEQMGTQHGQALAAFRLWAGVSPTGTVRSVERRLAQQRQEEFNREFGGDNPETIVQIINGAAEEQRAAEDEILTLWRMMQGEGNTRRGAAIAAALKAYMPTGPRNWMRTMEQGAQKLLANLRRNMQQRGGEQLARSFWQMMAGPRQAPGPLAAFDSATQAMLGDLLRRAVDRAGLVSEHKGSNQPTTIDKLVMNLSNDALRWDKVEQADALVREEIAAIEDPERREKLLAAWDEATGGMRFAIGGPALMRRALTDALKAAKPDWTAIFNRGREAAAALSEVKTAAVQNVMNQVARQVSSEQATALLPHLQNELAAAFDDIARGKHATWLEHRAQIANAQRVREARAAMMQALRTRGVAERVLDRLADALSDTPTWSKPAPVHPITQLIGEQMKKAQPDFVPQLQALGVTRDVGMQLERAIELNRQRAAAVARVKLQDQLIKRLTAKARATVRSKVPGFVKALLDAVEAGMVTREDFLDAYAKKFDKPRMTPEFAAGIRAQVERVQAAPEGSWLRTKEQNALMGMLTKFEGLKSGEIWTGFWYANILSGLGTHVVNLTGNATHLLLSTVQMLGTRPGEFVHFIRGMLAGSVEGARQGWAAFSRGEPVMRGDEEWQKQDVLELLWTTKNADLKWGKLLGKYGAASWGRYVFRALSAADSLFWNTAKEGRAWVDIARTMGRGASLKQVRQAAGLDAATWADAQSRAHEELKAAGRSTNTLDVDRRAFELVEAERAPEVTHEARRWGARRTYNYEPEGFMGSLAKLANGLVTAIPAARPLIPFVRIVANIADINLDWTPVGLARAVKGGHLVNSKGERFSPQERNERIVSGVVGTLGLFSLYALAHANKDDDDETVPFMIYGMGPKDSARRNQMPAGWKPYSVKIGDTYLSVDGTPLAFVFSIAGTALDTERYGTKLDRADTMERAKALLMASSSTLMNSGVLSSLKQTFDMLDGDRGVGPWAARMGSSLIPANSFLRDVAVAIDPVQTDSASFWATLGANIPVVRGKMQPLLNEFGEPVPVPGPWLLQRIIRNQDKSDPQAVWLAERGLHIPGIDNDVAVGQWIERKDLPRAAGGLVADRLFRAEVLERIRRGYLTPEERTAFIRETGPRIRAAVKILQQRAGKVDQGDVTAAVSAIRRAAMRKMIR